MNAKVKRMQELVADLSRDEIIWLNGYLAGIMAHPDLPGGKVTNAQPLLLEDTVSVAASSKSEQRSADHSPTGGVGGGAVLPSHTEQKQAMHKSLQSLLLQKQKRAVYR